jgi:uncharacterized protein YbjQ (UPF0145 family)
MDASQDDDNLLLDWYRRYVGTPEAERTVYGGFGLFFGGIGLALAGIAIFLASVTTVPNDPFRYVLREVAVMAAAVGLPALLVGITVLLPVDRKALYAAAAGSAICLAGVGMFSASYPHAFNVPTGDRMGPVIGVYAVGLVAVAASTCAALVGHHIDRASTATTERIVEREVEGSTTGDTGIEVTDEQVRRDIDREMADSELSWGGVAKTKTKRLKLNTADVDGIDSTNVEEVEAKTVRSSGRNVDDAVDAMRGLQGGETKQARSTQTTDDQTAALQALRERQAAEELAADDGVVDRIRDLFS